MSYTEKLKKIGELKGLTDGHGPLSNELLKKVNYKFRLEWNYTSNSMEGNSLTKSETRSVMIGNITVNGKPIKDVLEMKGHDEVISTILKMSRNELTISEKRIKEIHKGIMHEEDPEKQHMIGVWKKDRNYIHNYKQERFDFVAPDEVPERMHKLVDWVNAERGKIDRFEKDALHPVTLALQFHLDYVTIHPFYDGNGRTSRILTNILLIAYGYPPIYIKEGERTNYYQYIADIQGYGGSPDVFYEYMADLVLRSQQLVFDAVTGKDIEEADDLDKKIFLLQKEMDGISDDDEIKWQLTRDTFNKIYEAWLSDLVKSAVTIIQKFNLFFTGTRHSISFQGVAMTTVVFTDENPDKIINELTYDLAQFNSNPNSNFNDYEIRAMIYTNYGTLKKGGLNTFGCNYHIEIKFNSISYEVLVDNFTTTTPHTPEKLYEKLLHKPLTKEEIAATSKKLGDTIYQHIDFHTKAKGIR